MNNSEQIIARIKQLMTQRGVNGRKFAREIGIDTSNLSKYINGRIAISEALINRIVVSLGVSKQWLTTGEGEMFTTASGVITSPVSGVMLSSNRRGVPVYDVDVTAGNMPRSMMFTDDLITGWVDLPDLVDEHSKIVRVSGNSMAPTINSGDWIAVREITNQDIIAWGEIYVVQLDDFRMVKYLRRHENREMVILRSENKDYDDIEVRRESIRELMIVKNIIHFVSRM